MRLHAPLAIALLASLVACSRPHVPTENPVPPLQHVAPNWDGVFTWRVPIEVIPLVTGEIKVKRSLLLNLDSDRLDDREDRDMWVPVLAYLVRHPDFGDLLIDSGFDASFAESGHGNFGGLARFVTFARQPPGQDTVSLLRAAGVDPADLKMIILSHPHADHSSGLPDLPTTVPLLGGPHFTRNYETMWYAPFDHFLGFKEIRTLDFARLPDDPPGPAVDLYGDGSLFVISTPGHAEGNLSFFINGRNRVLLTCDASHTQEGFARRVGPGKVIDRVAADATIERLADFVAKYPEVQVRAGHDAGDWDLSRGLQDPL